MASEIDVTILSDNDRPSTRLKLSKYEVPNSERFIYIWANATTAQFYSHEVPLIANHPTIPDYIKEACRNYTGPITQYSRYHNLLKDLFAMKKIFIPTSKQEYLVFIKAVLEATVTNSSYKSSSIFAAAMCSLIMIGEEISRIVLDTIDIAYLPLNDCLKFYNLTNTGSCNRSTVINLALMSILSIGKSVTEDNNKLFQKNRFKACVATIQTSMPVPPAIQFRQMQDMKSGWVKYPDFITDFAKQFLSKDSSGQSNLSVLEVAVIGQAKLVLDHTMMKVFEMSLVFVNDFLRDIWLRIPGIRKDMTDAYANAIKFYYDQPESERPFIKLLKPAGYEILEYRNYPHIYYATSCLVKWRAGESSSMLRLVTGMSGLDFWTARNIRVATVSTPVKVTGLINSNTAIENVRNE